MPHRHRRILIYSHDTYGLGHLRRCHTIAHHLAARFADVSVLILTGSPIIGRFDFDERVDFVRIPGVIKQTNGDYSSLSLKLDFHETLKIRAAIIEATALEFAPDLFIVDKEPLGLHGEVEATLKQVRARGGRCILGLRDVLDAPDLLLAEWRKKQVFERIEGLYDRIWIYGPEAMGDPLSGLPLPASLEPCKRFTGYLHRQDNLDTAACAAPTAPYLLITPGGGGDGYEMVDGLLHAYEQDAGERAPRLPWPALIVLGPFMATEQRQALAARIERLARVEMRTFSKHTESLIHHAAAVVAMGGYNTFCEILSFNRRALIVPRTRPRMEQYILAHRAAQMGLCSLFEPDRLSDTDAVIAALCALAVQPHPCISAHPGLLDGLPAVADEVETLLREIPHECS